MLLLDVDECVKKDDNCHADAAFSNTKEHGNAFVIKVMKETELIV